MTSLEAVAVHLPRHSEPVAGRLRAFGHSDQEIKQYRLYYGFSEIRVDHDRSMAEQLIAAKNLDRLYLDNLSKVGHCFGADAFINYCSARADGRLTPGDRYLMTAVGLGATFSAMVFEH
ncbi:3-oxoacyl-[acyl-carrier-protein] synthase III C-terminal domain-containing protein [Nonomuraea sp. B1E8]|uniref:3-oxoacyl-[acyl-carrier-protein] synthase III C-terminal domain-containing protein n=1 Tax=unclassified Nonomuraea TaxID=2593643 RepID=UPI00325C6630